MSDAPRIKGFNDGKSGMPSKPLKKYSTQEKIEYLEGYSVGAWERRNDVANRHLGPTVSTKKAKLQAPDLRTPPPPKKKEEARIDWRLPAASLHDLVRGLAPFPGAFFEADLGKGRERVKVLRSELAAIPAADPGTAPGSLVGDTATVACGAGALHLVTVQRAGRGAVAGEDFLRGARLRRGAALA